jgi:molybdopterin molybdotransferase
MTAACRYKIDPDEALRLVLEAVAAPRPQRVLLGEAPGRVLAEEIRADRDYPPFDRAMMDGYAVRAAQAGATVEVVGQLAAGQATRGLSQFSPGDCPNFRPSENGTVPLPGVGQRQCLEIMTGAPCPPGTEAVVPKEQARRDGNLVTLPQDITLGEHVAPQGSECAAGSVVLRPGQIIASLAVAVLAAFGRETVEVVRRPSLAVITTGAELVPPGRQPGPGQIRDSNGPMLSALARQLGIEPSLRLHAEDDLHAISGALDQAAATDMILLTGGVSAGKFDLVPEALKRYGAEVIFRQVMQKPGKPLLLARKGPQLLFGLPGNPLSCHLVFHRYVAAAIRKFEGKPPTPALLCGQLAAPLRSRGDRTHFLLARAEATAESNAQAPAAWRVHPLRAASSADIFTPAGANCYVRVPPGSVEISAGEAIVFEWINDTLLTPA